MLISKKSGRSGHHFMEEITPTFYSENSGYKKEYWGTTRYTQYSYCVNSNVYYVEKERLPETKQWEGEPICPSCVLKAYKKRLITIKPIK